MKELIYSVKDVFSKKLGDKFVYRIPDYQRGYKWTEDNVRQLLDDIKAFELRSPEQFYCLQNITITKVTGTHFYNVIDGQQRLTTLYILLSYLDESELIAGKLEYAIRKHTGTFLKDDILSKKCWEEGYIQDAKHQDEYYILNAAKTIKTWFEPAGATSDDIILRKKGFKDKLLLHTKLIVNEVNGNEHQAFSNLNGVKVPLDAADLIRAMLITYSVKEGRTGVNIDPYRARMGAEIDSIDHVWSDPEMRRYFTQFLPEEVQRQSKELRFDISDHPINLLYLLFLLHKKESSKDVSVQAFESFIKNGESTFESIKNFHNDLMEWYLNNKLYHYVGFLFFNFKSNTSFKEIYALWNKSESKNSFLSSIKNLIAKSLIAKTEISEEQLKKGITQQDAFIKSIEFNLETNWYEEPLLPAILILNDIFIYERSDSLNRIPASFLRVNEEDREHISCQTPNKQELNNKERWLSDLSHLEEYQVQQDKQALFIENIKRLKERINKADEITQELKREIISSLTQFGLNSIGNIVLLNNSVNRGYRNSPFVEKRKAILNNFFNEKPGSKRKIASKNKFIRPFTLRTFLLNLSEEEQKAEKSNWTMDDIQNNANQIANEIRLFIEGGRQNG